MTATPPNPAVRQVLIIDRSSEARDVLRTVLQRQGTQILEACGAREGLELLRQHRPGVTVLDLDAEAADDETLREQYELELSQHDGALVVLGQTRRYTGQLPQDQVLAKPYHYAPLIRTIEKLLDTPLKRDSSRGSRS